MKPRHKKATWKIQWSSQPLGRATDTQIAARLGCSPSSVRSARLTRGIPRFNGAPTCPNGDALLAPSTDPKLAGCLECPVCGFVQGYGVIVVEGGGGPGVM